MPRLARYCSRCGYLRLSELFSEYNTTRCDVCVKNRKKYRNTLNGIIHGLYDKAKERSKRFGVPFDITPQYLATIFPKDNKCPYLGIKFVKGKKHVEDYSATLDRIVPSKGYVEGNVEIISMKANRIKSNATLEEIEMVAKRMKERSKK